jgi:cell division protein FtsQ
MEVKVAKKTDSKTSRNAGSSKEKQKFLRIITALIIICLTVIVIGFACIGVSRALFTKNDRLILRRIELNGMSPERKESLLKYLKLTLGEDNLFTIDIAGIRKKIEKISYVKSASVYRVLPDTIKIDIVQRVPIAYLFKSGAKWVVDEDSIVMNRRYCMELKYPLPVITGLKIQTISVGQKISGLTQAVKLIKLTASEFQNFKINSISLEDPRKITFMMTRKKRKYKVLIPRDNTKEILQVMHDAFVENKVGRSPTIDLTYKNKIYLR